ncbi:VQ motif-containing protein 20-like [Actinidia eriantha]|uniref:VQ motif-containing protein 20-like n=1 Tax=Actinidia eriantha TaxID=165200 RepID=UPI00258BE74E|nr:VQ motif-containing protein 20-like [Actinidia eriantha]
MSPTQFHEHQQQPKREINISNINTLPSPLKINKDSHFIKKSQSPPSSSSSASSSIARAAATSSTKPHHRHPPVIIYTHSPKIIHTHPRDFMALVQKLTGLSHSSANHRPLPPQPKQEPAAEEDLKNNRGSTEDNESSSVVTEENCRSSVVRNVQINSCFASNSPSTIFDPKNPCLNNIPFSTPNSTDFLSPPAPTFFTNYTDSFLFMPTMKEFYEF